MTIVKGDDVTIDMIVEIVDQFDYANEQFRKEAIDKCNNAVYEETDLTELEAIAKKYSEMDF